MTTSADPREEREVHEAVAAVCDECRDLDAELLAHYPGIRARPPQWCGQCAGPELAALVARGIVVAVTSTDLRLVDDAPSLATAAPAARPEVHEAGVNDLAWTVDLAVEMLRCARPSGRVFLRALVDEGGAATVRRLKELAGTDKLNSMTLTLNAAVRTVSHARRLRYDDRHLAKPLRDPDNPRRSAVVSYELPAALVPILNEALIRVGYPPGASNPADQQTKPGRDG